jgi:para-aminobenzoate synthetase component 1
MRCTQSFPIDSSRFDALAANLLRNRDADMLASPPGWEGESRSLIGIDPTAELLVRPGTAAQTIKDFAFAEPGPVLGFLSYTYGLGLRGVPSKKDSDFPAGHLKRYALIVTHDHATQRMTVSGPDESSVREIQKAAEAMAPIAFPRPNGLYGRVRASLSRKAYMDGVRRTLEHIRDGWTYQLNLSLKLSRHCPDLDPLALFLYLRNRHPAPFYGWFTSGPLRVLSASPERFLKVDDGQVLSQPIKGTMRAETPAPELVQRLTASPKEDAELSMIVDLIRNDISADCEYGSVRVPRHKAVFHVDRLLQMHSDVTGTLRRDRDCVDLLLNAFPGGSITGCPKQSSMRIIEELEPHARDVYCGSLLAIHGPRDMDSSIAIRTAVFDTRSGVLDTWAGSGIVVDSDPESEYLETMAKAEKFLFPDEEPQ